MSEDLKPLTAESLVPSPGIQPVSLNIWAEPSDEGSLRFVVVIPDSQVGTTAAAIVTHLFQVTASLFAEAGVKTETYQGTVPPKKEVH